MITLPAEAGSPQNGVFVGTLVLLALLLLGGCGGVVLERLQEDLEALRARVAAREEVKIHIAAAEQSVTKTSSRGDPSDPHVTVAVPPCPPAAVGRPVERPRRSPGRAKAPRAKGRRG